MIKEEDLSIYYLEVAILILFMYAAVLYMEKY